MDERVHALVISASVVFILAWAVGTFVMVDVCLRRRLGNGEPLNRRTVPPLVFVSIVMWSVLIVPIAIPLMILRGIGDMVCACVSECVKSCADYWNVPVDQSTDQDSDVHQTEGLAAT